MNATDLVRNRPMDPVLVQSIIDHRAVTSPAEIHAHFFGRERIRRAGILMALIAHLADNRAVHVDIEHTGLI